MNLSLFIVAFAVESTCARPENVNENSEQLDQGEGINDEESWKTSVKTHINNRYNKTKTESDNEEKSRHICKVHIVASQVL